MSGQQQADEDRQELEELKGQLGTCNVAPPDSLGFGRRFAEIISRIGEVKKAKPVRPKRKKFKSHAFQRPTVFEECRPL
jgi:hypothetical protein